MHSTRPMFNDSSRKVGVPAQGSLIMSAADVQELRDPTDFGNLFHHDSNPTGYATVPVTDGLVRGFVQRTLAFCSRP